MMQDRNLSPGDLIELQGLWHLFESLPITFDGTAIKIDSTLGLIIAVSYERVVTTTLTWYYVLTSDNKMGWSILDRDDFNRSVLVLSSNRSLEKRS